MSKDGNINDNSAISSGRKNENRDAYASNYDRIFGKKKKESKKVEIHTDTEALAWPSDESRMDVIGQNGNDGQHYNKAKDKK